MLGSKIKKIGDTQVLIQAGKGHRFVVVFRGKGLEGPLTDTDPGHEGMAIATAKPAGDTAGQKKVAKLIAEFYKQALPLLKGRKPANGFLMRGIAHQPAIPTFEERYALKAACIAIYPMYKGLAQLVGMKKIEGAHGHQGRVRPRDQGQGRIQLRLCPLQADRRLRRGRQLRGEGQGH